MKESYLLSFEIVKLNLLLQTLDREGMSLIERLDAPGFASYLKKTSNTICGRHPIGDHLKEIFWKRMEMLM